MQTGVGDGIAFLFSFLLFLPAGKKIIFFFLIIYECHTKLNRTEKGKVSAISTLPHVVWSGTRRAVQGISFQTG